MWTLTMKSIIHFYQPWNYAENLNFISHDVVYVDPFFILAASYSILSRITPSYSTDKTRRDYLRLVHLV